jgi:predicted phosphoribosyltransferase
VVPLTALRADHALIVPSLAGPGSRGRAAGPGSKAEAGEVVTVITTRRLRSVGEWYADFGQLTDLDVLTLLAAVPKR